MHAYVFAHAQNASQRARARVCARARRRHERRPAQGCDLHLGITVNKCVIYIIFPYARMHTWMQALVECISVCVGACVRACACARWERASTMCVTMPMYVCL